MRLDYSFPKLDSLDSEFIGSLWPSFRKRINNPSAIPLNTRHVENTLQRDKFSQYIYIDEVTD